MIDQAHRLWPRSPSEIKKMTELEAAQVGRMIDTDGWITNVTGRRSGPFTWMVGLYAKAIPELAHDLVLLTGAGTVLPERRHPTTQRWCIYRFWSILDLVRQIAPWSYKARRALPELELLAAEIPINKRRNNK